MSSIIRTFLHYAKKYRYDLLVICLFFFYATYMTWPFIIKPNTTITAPLVGDVSNSITKFDSIKQENKNPFVDWHLETIAAPEGITTNTSVDRVSFFSTITLWLTTLLTTSVIAHGLFTFMGYFLTGLITYLFLRRVFKNRIVAFLGGLAYASFPLFVSLARAAPTYIHMWLYVLPVWAFYELWKKNTRKRLVLAILSIVPALFWTPYFSYHILLIGCSLAFVYVAWLLRTKGFGKALKIAVIIGGVWLLFFILYYIVGMSSSKGGAPERSIQEIYDQSLHPLMLALPGAFSWWGQSGYELLHRIVPRALDTNLYLGVTVILLACFGTIGIFWKKVRRHSTPQIRIAGIFGLAVVITTFIFSLAPTIHFLGIDIPTPNKVVTHFMPALRAGQRLVMPMMLGFIILASIGAYVLVKLINRTSLRYVAATLIILLVGLDLSSHPPLLTSGLPQSKAATQLTNLPDGIVVQYINGSITGDPGQVPCQLRLIHHRTIVNFCGLEINYPKGELQPLHKLAVLNFDDQLSRYRQIGVKYIIVEHSDTTILRAIQAHKTELHQIAQDERFAIFELKT